MLVSCSSLFLAQLANVSFGSQDRKRRGDCPLAVISAGGVLQSSVSRFAPEVPNCDKTKFNKNAPGLGSAGLNGAGVNATSVRKNREGM